MNGDLHSWTVTEHTGVDWPRRVVWRDLPEGCSGERHGSLVVVDEAGRVAPAQWVEGRVCYPAELPAGAVKRYVLRSEDGERTRTEEVGEGAALRFSVRPDRGWAEVGNEKARFRLAWGEERFPVPRPMRQMPGAIVAAWGWDGTWFGVGGWDSDLRCAAWSCQPVCAGPVLVRLRQRYEVEGGGEIVLEYEVDAVLPTVLVHLSCDLPDGGSGGEAFWRFSDGFRPTHAFWRVHATEAWRGRKDRWGRQVYAMRFPEGEPDRALLNPFYAWRRDGAVFWSCWREEAGRDDLMVVGAVRASESRAKVYTPLRVEAQGGADGDTVTLRLPIHPSRKVFFIGLLDRREAGAGLDGPASQVDRLYLQHHRPNLATYLEMDLDWPGMPDIRFPRLLTHPDQLPALRDKFRDWTWLRDRLETHREDRLFRSHTQPGFRLTPQDRPLGQDPAGVYLATGDVRYARRAAEEIRATLRTWVEDLTGFGPAVNDYVAIAVSRPWRSLALSFDFIADSLPPDERLGTLRTIAFLCETLAHPDCWPEPASGIGRGNPNFHTDMVTAVGLNVALLEGHPRQEGWLAFAAREAEGELRRAHFESGCGIEAATYQAFQFQCVLLLAAALRRRSGVDLTRVPAFQAGLRYLAGIQTPEDPRCGFRMLPTVGHVTGSFWCQSLQVVFAWASGLAADDPDFSREMASAWRRAGSPIIGMHDYEADQIWSLPLCLVDPAMPDEDGRPSHGRSRAFEGLGAVMRAGHPDGSEGYLLFKMGASGGHYDPDEGSLLWYAYGAPVLTDFGCQYNPNVECAWLHNRISVDRANDHSRGRMLSSRFEPGADRVSGEVVIRRLSPYPEWPVREPSFDFRLLPQGREIAPLTWRRHLLYIHEIEAVAVWDEVSGSRATDWSLHVLSEGVRVERRRACFRGTFGVDLEVTVASPGDPAFEVSGFHHLGLDEPRLPMLWWRGASWMAPEPGMIPPMAERAVTLRARSGTGEDYVALLVARRTGNQQAEVTRLRGKAGFRVEKAGRRWTVWVRPGGSGWEMSVGSTKR